MFDSVKEIFNDIITWYKLELINSFSKKGSELMFLLFLSVVILLFFILFNIGIGLLLGQWLNNVGLGMLLLSGIYALVFLLMLAFKKPITSGVQNKIIQKSTQSIQNQKNEKPKGTLVSTTTD